MLFEAEIEWSCPETFPDLSHAKYIAIDLETRDPDLKSRGSGAVIGNGEIIGIAVAVEGWSGYYPIAHREGNLDKRIVLDWFKEVCATPAAKIFHNAMYDVCWIRALGFPINGHIIDTMVMASLIDENRMWYSLNSVALDYLGNVKDEKTLKNAAEAAGVDPKSEMYKLPAMYVGKYAEQDAALTLRLFKCLSGEIEKQKLHDIFDLETKLFPCLIDMKFKGVRVDIEEAHLLKKQLVQQENQLLMEIKKETNIDIEIWAARSIAKVFDHLSLEYLRTEKTKAPSFTKNYLQEHKHPLVNNSKSQGIKQSSHYFY